MLLFYRITSRGRSAMEDECLLVVSNHIQTAYMDQNESSATRECTDFQITSHIPFVLVFLLSIYMRFYEMTVLVGLLLISSTLYHYGAEKRTWISYVDNCTAFTLSMYGNVQLFFSPSLQILAINLSLGITSATIFVLGYTAACTPYYAYLHPLGLHILPAVWCAIVVVFQKPLVF